LISIQDVPPVRLRDNNVLDNPAQSTTITGFSDPEIWKFFILHGSIVSGFRIALLGRAMSQKQLRQAASRPLDESNAIRPED
jgi:hypothetical protein